MTDALPPRPIDRLDLDSFDPGTITAAWLPMLEDGLGQPLRIPLLVARGARPGPVVGITAAVHGDELNGIPAIHRLFASLEVDKLRGTVLAVVVANPLALHRRDRRLEEGLDLNHQFPGRKEGHPAQLLAYRLRRRILRKVDVLLDLHTASRGRVNSLYVRADMTDPRSARLAYLQRPQIIVHNPPRDGTLRGAAASGGIPSITVEIGDPQRFQLKHIRRTVSGIRAVMADLRMTARRPVAMGDPPVVCASSAWTYTDRGGLLYVDKGLTDTVTKGDTVARLVDVFGREITTYTASFDGVIVGHAVDPIAPAGSRIAHLGRPADPDVDGVLDREDVVDALAEEAS